MIHLYGKPKCGKCEAAKAKLQKMDHKFKVHDIDALHQGHDGWREDGSTEVVSLYWCIEDLPILRIGGKAYSYPAAMRLLKERRMAEKGKRDETGAGPTGKTSKTESSGNK